MTRRLESSEAIGAVDDALAGGGLEHGRRSTRGGGWKDGERVRVAKSSEGRETEVCAPGVVKIAAWEEFSWLKAGFSTRQGGGSVAYSFGEVAELNLGWTAEDEAATVAENRRRFLAAVCGGGRNPGPKIGTRGTRIIGGPHVRGSRGTRIVAGPQVRGTRGTRVVAGPQGAVELVTARQFHSGMVRVVERDGGALSTVEGKALLRGDGLMTSECGLMLGIQTADCVPVLIADTRTRVVAAFHAGWRGTLARIVERGVGTMRREFGSRPKDLVAAIGPAIGACCFAVGEEVRFEFGSQFAYAPELFSEVFDSDPVREKYPLLFLTARAPGHSNLGPQIHLDLWEANRRQLLDAGLKAKAIRVVGECTACARLKDGRRKYFSHRAEHGYTGRMLSVVGVANQ